MNVEAQPLAANIERLAQALEYLGAPLPVDVRAASTRAGHARDANALQKALDPHVLLVVHINPEARVGVTRGPAPAVLQQGGYAPVIVKVVNESRRDAPPGHRQPAIGTGVRRNVGPCRRADEAAAPAVERERESADGSFSRLEMFTAAPMTPTLSGLEVEYAVALIYVERSGAARGDDHVRRGEGTQDLGFRAEVPVLFTVKPRGRR